MARPIKETPILFGEDARRFEERMKEKRRETSEQRAKRLKDYELAMKIFKKIDMDRQLIETTYEMRKTRYLRKNRIVRLRRYRLERFYLNESFLYREALLAVSYVLENKVNQRSVAYFSLANDRISLSDFEIKLNSIVSANIGL